MTKKKYFSAILILGFLLPLITSPLSYGQGRVSYQELANSNRQRNIYLDFFTLPGDNETSIKFVSTYRIDYNFLPFKKLNSSDQDREFYSPLALSMEIFKAEKKQNSDDDISVNGLESITRTAISDTAFAKSYEQTQSNNSFISGYMQVDLEPGLYNYMLQLTPGENTRERTSRVRQVEIEPYENQKNGEVLLAESVKKSGNSSMLNLLTFGQNVYYGKDFRVLVHLPEYKEGNSYTASINRIDINRRDTTQRQQVFEQDISPDHLLRNIKPVMTANNSKATLSLQEVENGHTYALLKIPNSRFPNAIYRFEVHTEGNTQPVARSTFRSLWLEMPTSLLNLNVATDMLKFIVGKEELSRLQSGSQQEREEKFREFWKSKDPTPDTEFNELMAEYYRRIDYAYENFTTQNTIGYESDQGEIYIKYGPPKNIERKFPTGDPAVEIWTYDNRKFVFEATTGFGDFRLVSR